MGSVSTLKAENNCAPDKSDLEPCSCPSPCSLSEGPYSFGYLTSKDYFLPPTLLPETQTLARISGVQFLLSASEVWAPPQACALSIHTHTPGSFSFHSAQPCPPLARASRLPPSCPRGIILAVAGFQQTSQAGWVLMKATHSFRPPTSTPLTHQHPISQSCPSAAEDTFPIPPTPTSVPSHTQVTSS